MNAALLVLALVSALVVGLGLEGKRRREAARWAALRERGVVVSGTVRSLQAVGGFAVDRRVTFTVATLPDQDVVRTYPAVAVHGVDLRPGASVPVRMLPGSPESAELEILGDRAEPVWAPLAAGAVIAGLGVVAALVVR